MYFSVLCLLCASLVSVLVGCSSSQTVAEKRGLHVESSSTEHLIVSKPEVEIDENLLIVTGYVRRKPGYNGPTPGHLHLTITSASSGREIYDLSAHWNPGDIPTDGKRQSTYRFRFGYVPPKGSRMEVSYWDDDHSLPDSATAGQRGGALTGTPGTPRQPQATPRQPTGSPRQPGMGVRGRR